MSDQESQPEREEETGQPAAGGSDPAGGGPDEEPARAASGGPEGEPGPEGTGRAGAAGEDVGDGGGPGSTGWGGAISEMQNLVGDVAGDFLQGVREATSGRRFPRVDMVRSSEGDYLVLVDLPGLGREDVKVTTLGGELTVSGERPRPELPEGSEVLRTERGYGSFRRTLRLPPDVREADVAATLEQGVLEVRLPRKTPSEARTVEID